ncbi:MAG: hypothetical protein JSR61_21515 [Proteobacteria bacterium]|nr:hypothetical protein [Pseudomonadota bacterium]
MADRNALSKIGLLFMATTLLVMMTGAVVVADHLTGRLILDDQATALAGGGHQNAN